MVESVYFSISSSPFVVTVFQLMKRENKVERGILDIIVQEPKIKQISNLYA